MGPLNAGSAFKTQGVLSDYLHDTTPFKLKWCFQMKKYYRKQGIYIFYANLNYYLQTR